MEVNSCYTRYSHESWATGYQWAGMQHSGYKLGEQYEVVEVDEEFHQNSNQSLHLPLRQRQSEGVHTRTMPRGGAESTGPEITLGTRKPIQELETELETCGLGGDSLVVGGIITAKVLKGAPRDLTVTFCPLQS